MFCHNCIIIVGDIEPELKWVFCERPKLVYYLDEFRLTTNLPRNTGAQPRLSAVLKSGIRAGIVSPTGATRSMDQQCDKNDHDYWQHLFHWSNSMLSPIIF